MALINVLGLKISGEILLAIVTICNISVEPATTTTPFLTKNLVSSIDVIKAKSDCLNTTTERQSSYQRQTKNLVSILDVTATTDLSTC
ncbi:hypothetical protein DPMN_071604 [Dreissena polymorpha]|uniref:Uncharacterized protein n=1 Tax=Dreissena polymorpha TaxID=45954 RepID=A0A9D3Z397_DREPO|nr:hypothetical protein DPMN_071604 [Dreissena polymorpha]